MQITLTGRQRLNLEAILRSKPVENMDQMIVYHELIDKIKVSDEDRKQCFKEDRRTGLEIEDPAAVDAIEPLALELERSKISAIKNRLTEVMGERKITPDHYSWFAPMWDAVVEGSKHKPEAKE